MNRIRKVDVEVQRAWWDFEWTSWLDDTFHLTTTMAPTGAIEPGWARADNPDDEDDEEKRKDESVAATVRNGRCASSEQRQTDWSDSNDERGHQVERGRIVRTQRDEIRSSEKEKRSVYKLNCVEGDDEGEIRKILCK